MDDSPIVADINGNQTASKILKAPDFEALSKARSGIDQAHQEAASIIAHAHSEAESIRAQAYHDGQQQAAELITEYTARMHEQVAGSRTILTDTVMKCLRRLLEPVPPEELVAATVNRAMSETDIGRGAVLIVAPQLMHELREQFANRKISSEMLEVRGDPDCPLESSILRSDFGDIELGIELQLRAIERGLNASIDPS